MADDFSRRRLVMTGKQLKNSILQWAIQGKLVPQDPNDEPASVLLEKIRAEKARLIKEGKIKKDKKESIIYRGDDNSYYEKFADGKVVCIDDEIPFEIPLGWEWCRLNGICYLIEDCPHSTAPDEGNGYPLVRTPNVGFAKLELKGVHRVCEETYKKRNARATPQHHDLIFAREAPAGNIAVIEEEKVCLGQRTVLVRPVSKYINPYYLAYYILSPLSQKVLVDNSTGTTVAHVNLTDFRPYIIAIPPYSEQIRIVDIIKHLLPFIDKYGKCQIRLDKLNNSIDNSLKKTILQEAIQGKLVPQNASDEPASVLLQRIKEEKLRLVAEGKLKKKDLIDSTIFRGDDNKYFEKKGKEVACIDDEIPFEIPESWQWCRINTICNITNGFTPLRTEDRFWRNGDINWFTVEDIRTQGEDINYTAQKITKEATTPDRIVRSGSTLLCCTASVGQCAFTNIPTTTNQQFNALTIKDDYRSLMTDEYLFLFAKTLKDELHRLSGKTTFEFISIKKVGNLLVPIPPFNEQKRIVAIVNKSLASIMSRSMEIPYK